MLLRISVMLVSLFTLPAFAASFSTNETCQLKGQIQLSGPTQIVCMQDLSVEGNTEIITNGHELQIWVLGNADFGLQNNGLQVRAFDPSKSQKNQFDTPVGLGTIAINARSASGFLHIDNRGLQVEDPGGDISIVYGTTENYDQELLAGRAGKATLIRNGEYVALRGPLSKPAP